MRRLLESIVTIFAIALMSAGTHAAQLSICVDAREISRNRLHTLLTLEVKPGPLTLSYPKWIPGDHGPTGPIETMIGLRIEADGKRIAWSRDVFDMYSFH